MAGFVWRDLWEYPAQTGLASSEFIQKLRERDAHSKILCVLEPRTKYFLNYALGTISAKPLYK